jgi:phage repressor protein C with HTH and peptisase S24 domain
MSTIGDRVKAEREGKGWSQAELARRVTQAGYSITQGGIAQIERRGETEPKSIVQLAQALGLSVHWLQSGRGDRTAGALPPMEDAQLGLLGPAGRRGRGFFRPGGRPPLQVFASAQGGEEGAITLSSEPVAWIARDARLEGVADAYGCFVSGESMEPAYEKGNLLLVNPAAPVGPGDDVVFMREDKDGTRYVLLKRLVKANPTSWTVKQYNPARTFTLSRKEWGKAHLVIGKYNKTS